MMHDLEGAIGKQGEVGTGGTEQQPDGTWLAWVVVLPADYGLYAAGATENHALQALEAKLLAIGKIMSAGYAEAECRLRVRKRAEESEALAKLTGSLADLLGPATKKPEGN
jgi:hypothetical protein